MSLGRTLLILLVFTSACRRPEVVRQRDSEPEVEAVPVARAPVPTSSVDAEAPVVGGVTVCTHEAVKVWSRQVSAATELEGIAFPGGGGAVGVLVSGHPHVLTQNELGVASFAKVEVAQGSPFAREVRLPDVRTVFRVTPIRREDGKLGASVDYRDELAAPVVFGKPPGRGTRHVACGPVDRAEKWVDWEGPTYLDDPPEAKPVQELARAGLLKEGSRYVAERTCRSFFDPSRARAWAVGAEVVVKLVAERTEARASLFVVSEANGRKQAVHGADLQGDPLRIVDFDAMASRLLPDGRTVVSTLAGGAVETVMLGPDYRPLGLARRLTGAFLAPRVSADGSDAVVLASRVLTAGTYAQEALRVTDHRPEPEPLPGRALDALGERTVTAPRLVRDAEGRRFLSYVSAVEGKRKLALVEVSARLAPEAKPYVLTDETEKVIDAHVLAAKSGALFVVYTRATQNGYADLVSAELVCKREP
jgi:hypothetical protein